MPTRIAGYDFARSLALFGLVIANFSRSVDRIDFYWLHSLIEGGATTTFLVLGGVGISLLTQRARITSNAHGIAADPKRLIKRAASLLVVGIGCSLIWTTNFLCLYSICIIIGALLMTISSRWLWPLACVCGTISVIFTLLVLSYSGYFEVLPNWKTLWNSNSWTIKDVVFSLYFSELRSIFSWTGFLLIGMWLGRQAVHHPRVRRAVFFCGIVFALVACTPWLLIHYAPLLLRYVPLVPSRPSLADISGPGLNSILTLFLLLDIFAICGTAIIIIGGSLMLTEKYPDARWTRPFLATGQLALTLYVAHLVIDRGMLEALGALENQTLPFAIGSAVIFFICAIIFSHFWRKRFERGPLEWTMRRITG